VFWWPELDAELTRSGPGAEVTELAGVRLIGEPTAVVRFDVTASLTRSDRPQQQPVVLNLPRSAWIRALRKDTRERWADLGWRPEELGGPDNPGPPLRTPANMHTFGPSMFRLSDLGGAGALFRQGGHSTTIDGGMS